MKQLILHHHLGLGDHFICNGLVHALKAELGLSTLHLAVKQHNLPTVQSLYQGHDDIRFLVVPPTHYDREDAFIIQQSKDEELPLMKISYSGAKTLAFDVSFYAQAGLDLGLSWSRFAAPVDTPTAQALIDNLIQHERYCLVANAGSVGAFDLNIDTTLPVYHVAPGHTQNLIDWSTIIGRASEIHCIDSSVIHLVDRLPTRAEKLVYHDVGRGSRFHLNKPWLRRTNLAGRTMKTALNRVFDDHFNALPDEHILELRQGAIRILNPRKAAPKFLRSLTNRFIRKTRKRGWSTWRHVCHYSFHMLVEEMASLKHPPRILETGSAAHGTNSSLLFFAIIDVMGGTFDTVDLNPEATRKVQTALEQGYPHLQDRIHCHTQDSVALISQLPGPFDVVYLDSYDLYPGIFKESEAHGLQEFNGIVDKLADEALVLIDDTPRTREIFRRMTDDSFMAAVDAHLAAHQHLPGKGSLVLKQIAQDPRFTVLHHEYQLLLKFKR